MNKYEKALMIISSNNKHLYPVSYNDLQELVERATPKKMVNKECPNIKCNAEIKFDSMLFCHQCGQALRSDEKYQLGSMKDIQKEMIDNARIEFNKALGSDEDE